MSADKVMNPQQALDFVREHGVVLVSAKGPVPKLVDAIAGEAVKGSWWGHPQGKRIFAVLQTLAGSEDILTCRLVGDKITLVHRRLWPALVAASSVLTARQLARVQQEHTAGGHHENEETPFPGWVPPDILKAATSITQSDALAALGPWAVKQGDT
jgi:hypothetical protein